MMKTLLLGILGAVAFLALMGVLLFGCSCAGSAASGRPAHSAAADEFTPRLQLLLTEATRDLV